MAATHLARKAEAVLTVALTLQLVASLSCGHARVLLRGGQTAAGGNEPDFGLQHAGLSAQAYAQGHDSDRYARKARAMHVVSRKAEETYEDWNKLQDGYDAEMRLHRERLEATSGIQLLAAQPMQPGTDAAQQHTVAAVHRPLFAGTEVPKRDEEDAPAHEDSEESTPSVNDKDDDAAAGQHTVDQQEEDMTEPAQVQGAADDADSTDVEDIHSSTMDGTMVVGEEATAEPEGRRRLLSRRLLLGSQQQPAATTAADSSSVSWSVRTLQQLTSPFGALGMFAGATDPVQIVSSAAAITL